MILKENILKYLEKDCCVENAAAAVENVCDVFSVSYSAYLSNVEAKELLACFTIRADEDLLKRIAML